MIAAPSGLPIAVVRDRSGRLRAFYHCHIAHREFVALVDMDTSEVRTD